MIRSNTALNMLVGIEFHRSCRGNTRARLPLPPTHTYTKYICL